MTLSTTSEVSMSKLYDIYFQCGGVVSTDSRKCQGGELYFALRGDNFDGNRFAQSALDNGARWAVVDRESSISGENIFVVVNTLHALQELAAYHREQLGITIFALTGTNGKTTTKEFVRVALQAKYTNVGCTEGNLNNHIGVPLTLLSFTPQTEIGVVEMGANHRGEIAELCQIAKPNVGLITNVGSAHLEGFGSPQGVIEAKGELYDYLNGSSGVALYNSEDETLCHMIAQREGLRSEEYHGASEAQGVALQLFGEYNRINASAAIHTARYFGVPSQAAKEAVSQYTPQNNRSQVIENTQRGNNLIVDCYNANPSSMAAAITEFLATAAGNNVLILGAMRELGEHSGAEHKKIVDICHKGNAAECYFVGEEWEGLVRGNEYYGSVAALAERLKLNNRRVLLKGSRSVELEKLLSIL